MICKQKLTKTYSTITLLTAFVVSALSTGCFKKGNESVIRAEGAKAKVLHIGNAAEPSDLDPQTTATQPEQNIYLSLYEGLVSVHPQDLSPVAGVAERWEVSEDGRTYTFYLREAAKWSNGDAVTAGDFLFAYERLLSKNLGAPNAQTFYCVEGAEAFHKGNTTDFSTVGFKALDAHTLQIQLTHALPHFLNLLCHHSWAPVHPVTILQHGKMDQRGTQWTRPGNLICNGPFKLKEWNINDKVVVEKNPFYWDANNVKLDEICFYSMDGNTEEMAYRSKQLHVTSKVPASNIVHYQKKNTGELMSSPTLGTEYYLMNTAHAPFNDVRVRKALAMSIDRDALTNRVLQGQQQPANFFTPPNTAGYTCEHCVQEDMNEARKLLTEAGFPEGKGFPEVELLYNTSDRNKKTAEAIQEMWHKNLGIKVVLRNEELKVYLASRRAKDFQVLRASWVGDYLDASTFLELFTSSSNNNFSNWSNEDYDRLIKEASVTLDRKKRLELFNEAEGILLREQPIIPLFYYTSIYLVHPSVKGWHPNVLDLHPHKYLSLE